MTIVMVTHERPLAERFANRIVTLSDGKLISDAPTARPSIPSLSDQPSSIAPKESNPRGSARPHRNAVRTLREALLRHSLTTLGVAVGVASLVAMLSLGVGLETLASKRLLRSGLFDSVLVSSGRGEPRGPMDRAAAKHVIQTTFPLP